MKGSFLKNRRCLRLMVFIVFGLLAVIGSGCSDSDDDSGGSSTVYTGNTSPASITTSNAEELLFSAAEVTDLADMMDQLDVIGGAGDDPAKMKMSCIPLSLKIANDAKDGIIGQLAMDQQPASSNRAAAEQSTAECSGGGSISISVSENLSTGQVSGTITYNSCTESGATISGTISFSGNVNTVTEDIENLSMTFSNLKTSIGGYSFTLEGTISVSYSGSIATMEIDMAMSDSTGESYWANGYVITMTESGDITTLEIEGRYYDYTHGYVDIDTTVTIEISYSNENPYAGEIIITGASGTKAKLEILSSTQYKVWVDADGNGSYEAELGPYNWSDSY